MRASQRAVELIKRFESFAAEAYLCPAKVWTIGWGHTRGVRSGMRIDQPEGERLLVEDIERVERELQSLVSVPVAEGQWDALVCLCFNLRGGPKRLIGTELLAKLNAGDCDGAAQEFLDITKAGGIVLAGLVRRRQAEVELFQSV